MDSLPYSIPGLTVNADYHQGNLVWNTNTSAYETWSDANYKAGHYSVSAPQDGGAPTTLAGVVLNSTTSVTVTSTAALSPGMSVFGAGIPSGATVASISSGTVFVLSAAATTSSASGTYTAGNNSGRYSATTPAGVLSAGAYDVMFRRHVDGTAANDTPIGFGSSSQLASVSLASAASAAALNPGNGTPFTQDFNCLTGAYWQQSITITGLVSTRWTQYVWTLKGDAMLDSDEEALITIRVTNGGSGSDGLLINNGRAAATASNASLAVAEVSPDTSVTWTISAAAMDVPPSPQNDDYWWELTCWIGSLKQPVASGRVVLSRSVRRSTSAP